MSRLEAELQRLYLAGGSTLVRAPVLELARPGDWATLAKVWKGVQADLELPAPAIAVTGTDGYQLWFSLAQPVPPAQAQDFLQRLCRRYLPDVAPERIATQPNALPPREVQTDHWAAFVTPDLAAVFADEPWLDLPPGSDAQAELLSRIESVKPEAWQRALQRLHSASQDANDGGSAVAMQFAPIATTQDPRRFLLDVMNDGAVELRLRIEAAKALLQHTERP
jgi:hypothetical protein